jgi:hypothetical protein
MRPLLRLSCAGATALACASPAPVGPVGAPAVGPAIADAREIEVVMVLPLNIAVAIPKELEVPSLAVWQSLEDDLRARGVELKTISYSNSRRLWKQSVEQARRTEKDDAAALLLAMSLLAVELRRHTEFDAVVAPSVLIQQSSVDGTRASWDGVTREIEVHREFRSLHRSRFRAGKKARSASLHVAVFDANGGLIHVGQGGLDLLVRLSVNGYRSSHLAAREFQYFEPRPEVFNDPDLLREGIAKALDPFLSQKPSPGEPL